jgi:L-2-amino-thiazoline-4-carboxylic acid hydrolase
MSMIQFLRKGLRHYIFGHSSTQFLIKGLKKAIKQQLKTSPKPIIKDIKTKAKELYLSNQHFIVDEASKGHVEFSSHVLASYLSLLPLMEQDTKKTVTFIQDATMKSFDTKMLHLTFKLIFSLCKNNKDRLNAVFSWMMKQYGSTFTWKSQLNSHQSNQFCLTITRCFYFEFFKAHEALFLMPILCQLDKIWFDLLSPEKYGLMFDKSHYQAQGLGADKCIFPIKEVKIKEN